MNKPLREHYFVETDQGVMFRTEDYLDDLEKYVEHMNNKLDYVMERINGVQ